MSRKNKRESRYQLDEFGYAVVEIYDDDGTLLSHEEALQKLFSDREEDSEPLIFGSDTDSDSEDLIFEVKECSDDETSEKSTLETSSSKTSLSRTSTERWDILADVSDPELVRKVEQKNITREDILNSELTDLVRGAYYNTYLAERLKIFLGFNPLPLSNTLQVMIEGKMVTKKCRLLPHQVKTLTFMREREAMDPRATYGVCGGILCLKMGLGKTLCSLTHSLLSPREKCSEKYGEKGFPTLIIVSKTLMSEWQKQAEDFFGDRVKILYFHKDYLGKEIETITRQQIVGYDFVITTYDVCQGICSRKNFHEQILELGDDHTLMKGKVIKIHTRARANSDRPEARGPSIIYCTPWNRVIADESTRFCNPDAQTYRYIMAIYGRYKWCLSGKPVRNKDIDLWAQLRFCGYMGVERKVEWKRQGYHKMAAHGLTTTILKMTYEDAGIQLPLKHETPTSITLSGNELECYEYVQKKARLSFDLMLARVCDFASVLAMFTRLRQCCIAPYLITRESKREKGTQKDQRDEKKSIDELKEICQGTLGAWVHDKNGTAGIYSTKISEIISVLHNIPPTEKVLVFSMFTSVLDLIADACKVRLPDFGFVQVDGDTRGVERHDLLTEFRTRPSVRGLFLTYKVGAEGLNLIEATHVVRVEPWWTNAVHEQADSRCHRMGQTREVQIHNVLVENSIEESIMKVCRDKDEISDKLLTGSGQKITAGLDKYTLGQILGVYQ